MLPKFLHRITTKIPHTFGMPLFRRAVISQPASPPPGSVMSEIASSWEVLGRAPTSPSKSPSIASNFSWDSSTFPETSTLLPTELNGDWRTTTADAFKHPSATAKSVNDAFQWPQVRQKLTNAAEAASEGFQERLNRAFEGSDVPAMHDKAMSYVPSLSIPTLHQVSQSVDALTDKAHAVLPQRRHSNAFTDEELAGDHLAFAYQMSQKARRALVKQGICKSWQTDATRATVQWYDQLNAKLFQLFSNEKVNFGVKQLFQMSPIWTGDVGCKTWNLELDTGMTEVVAEGEGDECEEKRVCLAVGFTLPETAGCVRVEDVERGTVDEEDWMAVQ
ncbi:hypothetical protein HBI56_187000 [Parastagonospora nodorum]|nr:hypothetical protein HBH53_113950 [Parastagonospora nodorum]KAH4160079.1 hypothetical protein HBH43_181500 [Parastagonospora nodorum]KAH4184056.1 hypothetical protein HBH42_197190 [Parastagonospora nodorum]KAH5013995.1 hypothetical protein HBI74_182310 [Parastagonospora nodorum]KAH5261553.1 hypothetical protein HBI70_160510 [Parastagonospora nodorum]